MDLTWRNFLRNGSSRQASHHQARSGTVVVHLGLFDYMGSNHMADCRTTAIGVLAAPGRCRSEKATGIVGIIYLFCLPCSPFPCLGLQLVGTVSHVCRMRTFMHGSPASS
uniref:ARAD1D03762p n=1 Tax=Blastobotrys adeninivorans TaxID=409370 RepID=A0A060T828_BLAAD